MPNKAARLTFVTSALAAAFALAGGNAWADGAVSGWHVGAGTVVSFTELELHVKGEPLSVYEIVYALHPMDSSGSFEPIGLWIYN